MRLESERRKMKENGEMRLGLRGVDTPLGKYLEMEGQWAGSGHVVGSLVFL